MKKAHFWWCIPYVVFHISYLPKKPRTIILKLGLVRTVDLIPDKSRVGIRMSLRKIKEK